MPIKRVQFPDGSIKRVEVPEGATNEQIIAFVASQHKPQAESYADKQKRAEQVYGRVDPTEGMSGGERFMAGVGKSLYDTGRGVKQLFGGMSREEVDEQRRVDAPLLSDGAAIAGNIAGTVGQIFIPGGVAARFASGAGKARTVAGLLGDRGVVAARAVKAATLPTTLRGAAAQGGVIGSLQQVGEGDSRVGNALMGGGLGFAGAAAPRVIGSVYRGTRNAVMSPTVSGAQREAVRTIRGEAANPDALMVANPSRVPGVTRTLFEETLDPGIARLETKSRGTGLNWPAFDSRNNAARVTALRGFAGDEADIVQAVAARSKAADPPRTEALKVEGVDTSRLLSQIKRMEKAQEGRPQVQGALSGIRSLLTREIPEAERKKAALSPLAAFVQGDKVSATNREAARAAMTMIRNGEMPSAKFIASSGTAGTKASKDAAEGALKAARKAFAKTHAGQDKAAVLNNVRLTLGDMLAGKYGGDSGAALVGAKSLVAVKNQLDRVMAKYSPEWGESLDAFRKGSVPINRMETGQMLIKKGSGSQPDPATGMPQLMPGLFGGQVKNLDQLAKTATGFRKATADGVLGPQAMDMIGAVNDDLGRQMRRLSYGSGGGSHTNSQGELGKRLMVRALGRVIPGVNNAVEFMEGIAAKRVAIALEEVLANPSEFRRIAASLPPQERMLFQQVLSRIGGTTGALSPALAE